MGQLGLHKTEYFLLGSFSMCCKPDRPVVLSRAANYTGKCNYPFFVISVQLEASSNRPFLGISKLTHKMHP